jgi:hypothetical protein
MPRPKKPTEPTPARRKRSRKPKGACLIPPRVPTKAINQFAFKRDDAEARRVVEYLEWQWGKDKRRSDKRVTFLERVLTEHVMGVEYACWNVHSNRGQWRVIDGNAMNLYSQKLFPSLDYLLSFHIGLMYRVASERTGTEDPRLADRLAGAFRKWEQAAKALDASSESEEVQAVGMRCREALLAFIRSASDPAMVPSGTEAPQASNFVKWSELITNHVAAGSRNERIRGYLKALAKETWELVNWLTHTANASKIEGTMAIDATHSVLEAFGAALIGWSVRCRSGASDAALSACNWSTCPSWTMTLRSVRRAGISWRHPILPKVPPPSPCSRCRIPGMRDKVHPPPPNRDQDSWT